MCIRDRPIVTLPRGPEVEGVGQHQAGHQHRHTVVALAAAAIDRAGDGDGDGELEQQFTCGRQHKRRAARQQKADTPQQPQPTRRAQRGACLLYTSRCV